jgi:hypothetical protein
VSRGIGTGAALSFFASARWPSPEQRTPPGGGGLPPRPWFPRGPVPPEPHSVFPPARSPTGLPLHPRLSADGPPAGRCLPPRHRPASFRSPCWSPTPAPSLALRRPESRPGAPLQPARPPLPSRPACAVVGRPETAAGRAGHSFGPAVRPDTFCTQRRRPPR